MIIETTLLVIGALTAVACLSLSKIKSWLRNRANAKYGDLVKRDLRDGKVEVVVIGLSENGTQTGEKTYTAKSLAPDLAAEFGYSNRTRIYV
jgi:hypothetical protein